MGNDAYRLWEHWQQMHYPRRGLPADEAARARLVLLDGTAGTVLESYFTRGTRAKRLAARARAMLDGYRLELDRAAVSADASRYFGRLRRLIELVLAEAAVDEFDNQPVFASPPLAAKERP